MDDNPRSPSAQVPPTDYPVTRRDFVRAQCPACAMFQPVYIQRVEGEWLMCCSVCQRIIKRWPI